MLLKRGDLFAIGKPQDVADNYLALNFDRDGAVTDESREDELVAEFSGSHEARILDAWIEDGSGARQNVWRLGEWMRLRAAVAFDAAVEDPAFTVEIEDDWGTKMFVASSAAENERSGRFASGEEVIFTVEFENHLAPGGVLPDSQRVPPWQRPRHHPP
jgi:hypothetical protein